MKISGSRTNILAAATRWICPPDSFTPLAPITVSSPSGNPATSGDNGEATALELEGHVLDMHPHCSSRRCVVL
jgi:hypothetical protein